jgi:hypothetical protein
LNFPEIKKKLSNLKCQVAEIKLNFPKIMTIFHLEILVCGNKTGFLRNKNKFPT